MGTWSRRQYSKHCTVSSNSSMQLISIKHLAVSETLSDLIINLNSREMFIFHKSYASYKITFVGKKTARCAFCCWVNSHPGRGTSYFKKNSANFLEKYFRRNKPKETKKLMVDGLDAVLRLLQCSLGLDPLGQRTSKVLAFTVVRGNVRERMLPRCILHSQAVLLSVFECFFFRCNICLHFFQLSADEVFPVDHGLVKPILSFPGTES